MPGLGPDYSVAIVWGDRDIYGFDRKEGSLNPHLLSAEPP